MKRYRILLPLLCVALLVSCNQTSSREEPITGSEVVSEISDDSLSETIASSEKPRELTTVFFQNPIYNADFPDPSIVRHTDGQFYTFATGGRIIKSANLVEWEALSNAIARPTWGTPGANIWAPDVQYINGQYVMYYSLSRWDDPNPGIGIATATHPAGPWTDHGKFFLSQEIGVNNSIDPMVFVDEDERVYMFWGSFRGIYAIELTADGLGFKDGSVEQAANNKVHIAGFETNRNFDISTFEGVYIIKKDNYYYMFLSTGTCCSGDYTYNVVVGRSVSILGEYFDSYNRSMKNANVGHSVVHQNDFFIGVGHNSILRDDAGTYWILYHGFDATVETRNARKLLIDKLIWNADNWPSTLGNVPSNNYRPGPELYLSDENN